MARHEAGLVITSDMPSNAGLVYEAKPRSILSDFGCVRFGLISLRYQTVPSPFGSGSSVSEVVPCILHSLLLRATRRRSTGEERFELSTGAHSTHQDDERHYEVLVFFTALSSRRTAFRGYRLRVSDAQPASLVSLTLCVLPRTITKMVPEMPYSRL